MKRIKGFVVGYDKIAGEVLWTVKVKDQNSAHNNQKFTVASLHPGTMLTRPGIDVTFRVQTFGSEQEKVLRAVDVSIGSVAPEEKQIVEKVPQSLTLVVTEGEIGFTVWHSECSSSDEARQLYCNENGEKSVVGLIEITPELVLKHGGAISDEEAVAGLATIRQLTYLDPLRDVVIAIAMEAFELGRKTTTTQTTIN